MTAVAPRRRARLAGRRARMPFLAGVEERLAGRSCADDLVGPRRRAGRWPPAASACGRCSAIVGAARRARAARARAPRAPSSSCTSRRSCTTTCSTPAPLRRGRPTVWAATARRSRARPATTSSRSPSRGLAETGTPTPSRCWPTAALGLAQGEALQSEQARATRDHARAVPRALRPQDRAAVRGRLRARRPCSAGRRTRRRRARRYGEQLGLAFQIADDVLDCAGDPESTGKPIGTDLLDGTATLPLLLAAQRDEHVAARWLDRERAAGRGARRARPRRRERRDRRGRAAPVLDARRGRPRRRSPRCPTAARRALEAVVQAATTRDH